MCYISDSSLANGAILCLPHNATIVESLPPVQVIIHNQYGHVMCYQFRCYKSNVLHDLPPTFSSFRIQHAPG